MQLMSFFMKLSRRDPCLVIYSGASYIFARYLHPATAIITDKARDQAIQPNKKNEVPCLRGQGADGSIQLCNWTDEEMVAPHAVSGRQAVYWPTWNGGQCL